MSPRAPSRQIAQTAPSGPVLCASCGGWPAPRYVGAPDPTNPRVRLCEACYAARRTHEEGST